MKLAELMWWARYTLWPSVVCRLAGHVMVRREWHHVKYVECERCGYVSPYVETP